MHAANVKKGGKPYVFKVKEFNELILGLANPLCHAKYAN